MLEESIGLCPTKKYSWRVRARNSAITGPWSRWTGITVSNLPVTLISPKDLAQITDSSVRLKWRRFEGVTEYDFEVFEGSIEWVQRWRVMVLTILEAHFSEQAINSRVINENSTFGVHEHVCWMRRTHGLRQVGFHCELVYWILQRDYCRAAQRM